MAAPSDPTGHSEPNGRSDGAARLLAELRPSDDLQPRTFSVDAVPDPKHGLFFYELDEAVIEAWTLVLPSMNEDITYSESGGGRYVLARHVSIHLVDRLTGAGLEWDPEALELLGGPTPAAWRSFG